ncbi:unnamed protein product [Durusdinium trenchii]|uniref:Cation-transporting P-type ATPase C-terminal domain-containing protein n=1 Tax=Durusdinium trenchii TaxID=1381693 RepID=A0ABP0L959_9DINO
MMQYAIILAQLALYAAVFIPFFSDKILELVGLDIGEKGWAMAVIGPVGTLILCELSKVITYYQMKNYQRWLAKKEAENAAKLEADIAATPRKEFSSEAKEPFTSSVDKIEKVERPPAVRL